MQKAGVIGVGIGPKESGGVYTNQLSLVALVERKQADAALSADDKVPSQLDGLVTDVQEIGVVRAQNTGPRSRWRNIIPAGVSVGHYLVSAGTLGAIVYDQQTNFRYLLSNNHVLANSNYANLGDPILQPGATDGGMNPQDVVARLERYMPLRYLDDPSPPPAEVIRPDQPVTPQPPPATPTPQPDNGDTPDTPEIPSPDQALSGCTELIVRLGRALSNQGRSGANAANQSAAQQAVAPSQASPVSAQVAPENGVDAALGQLINPGMFSDEILQLGKPTGTRPPQIGLRLRKMGRTTGLTFGNITLINATIDVGYGTPLGNRTARFTGQIITSGMSQGGDSGSLVLEETTLNAVGLLFAGSAVASIITPIDRVLNTLGVRF